MCLYPRILSQESFIRSYKWFLLEKHKVTIAKAHSVAVGNGSRSDSMAVESGSRTKHVAIGNGSRSDSVAVESGRRTKHVAVVLFCTPGLWQ